MAQARMVVMASMVATLTMACHAQDHKKQAPNDHFKSSEVLPADTPKVDVHVNKVYDEHGNLVRYDSTYTRFYEHLGGDSLRMDSLMRRFLGAGGGNGSMELMGPDMDNLFFNDSLLGYDFFHDDFFRKRMELNQAYMDQLMQRMDSLKNRFFEAPTGRQD